MNYYENIYWGMHWIWWILWLMVICWIFIVPYDIPGQRTKKEDPINILKRRLASGEITVTEFEDLKQRLKEN